MALQLGALREALIEAGSSPEKAGRAAEELAGYDKEFVQLRSEVREGFFRNETALAALRTELRGDNSDLRSEVRGEIAELRSDIKLLKWMVGTSVAGTIAILLHTFLR